MTVVFDDPYYYAEKVGTILDCSQKHIFAGTSFGSSP